MGRLVLDNVTTGAGVRIINASKLGNIEIPNYEIEKCLRLGERIKSSVHDMVFNLTFNTDGVVYQGKARI